MAKRTNTKDTPLLHKDAAQLHSVTVYCASSRDGDLVTASSRDFPLNNQAAFKGACFLTTVYEERGPGRVAVWRVNRSSGAHKTVCTRDIRAVSPGERRTVQLHLVGTVTRF